MLTRGMRAGSRIDALCAEDIDWKDAFANKRAPGGAMLIALPQPKAALHATQGRHDRQ